eukprot:4899278-Pyramimonas_sp.AAC.2
MQDGRLLWHAEEPAPGPGEEAHIQRGSPPDVLPAAQQWTHQSHQPRHQLSRITVLSSNRPA